MENAKIVDIREDIEDLNYRGSDFDPGSSTVSFEDSFTDFGKDSRIVYTKAINVSKAPTDSAGHKIISFVFCNDDGTANNDLYVYAAQYNSSWNMVDDGDWTGTGTEYKLHKDTEWIVLCFRLNNGETLTFNYRCGIPFTDTDTPRVGELGSYRTYVYAFNTVGSHGMKITWFTNVYVITLDKQGGSGGTSTIYERYDNSGEFKDGGYLGGYFANKADALYTNYSETLNNPLDQITKVTVPTKTSDNVLWEFQGYYTGKNGTGKKCISANGTIIVDCKTFTSHTTLYAYWISTPILKITLDANGGNYNAILKSNPNYFDTIWLDATINKEGQVTKYVSMDEAGNNHSLLTPERENYIFTGYKVTAGSFTMSGKTYKTGDVVTLTDINEQGKPVALSGKKF